MCSYHHHPPLTPGSFLLTANRIYCYLSQGTDQFMQYTVNIEKYQCKSHCTWAC